MARRTLPASSKLKLFIAFVSMAVLIVVVWKGCGDEDPVDLSGSWTITNTAITSSLERYEGNTFAFKIHMLQNGNRLTGEGEQILYNGKPARNHYPITITDGRITGNEVILQYRMKGGRSTSGMFTLVLDPENSRLLHGTFTSSAANTRGTTDVEIGSN